MTKDQLIAELRKQGYGRIADMLDAEPLKVREYETFPTPVSEWAKGLQRKAK